MLDSQILSDKDGNTGPAQKTLQWRLNDARANKQGVHNKIYWVKEQPRQDDGTHSRARWVTSDCYQGNWKDNKKSGFGIQFYQNGDKFEGEWFDNKKQGYGTLWVRIGKKKLVRSYTGQFLDDRKHGKGTMYFPNGDRYDGNWEADEMTGFGRMVYASGDVYVGQWGGNQRNGYGLFTKSNRDYYEGNWLMDKREGYGSYCFAESRKVIVGEWVDDSPKASVLYRLEEGDGGKGASALKARMFHEAFEMQAVGENLRVESLALPLLELEDPIGVLEAEMMRIREQRLSFRILYSPLECLAAEGELKEWFEQFCEAAPNEETVGVEWLLGFIGCDSDTALSQACDKLGFEHDSFTFEQAVRLKLLLEN